MYTLGIETSCDETSAAVVKGGNTVLSNVVSSSLKFHQQYAGIIPEIASRKQLESIAGVTDACLKEAGLRFKDINLVSVTNRPGLLGSLVVGVSFAKSISFCLKAPLIGVDHIYAHIYANFLNHKNIKMPLIALIVSGGHTSLFLVNSFDKIQTLGQTQDDAAGEAFDKVAKILKLGYPGGPAIEKAAKIGDPKKVRFKCSGTQKPLNFSFSGIKTAVLYYASSRPGFIQEEGAVANIAASFQSAVVDALVNKTLLACKIKKINTVLVGGGVAANSALREGLLKQANLKKIKVYFPQKCLCMDNAAMVAGLGYQLFKKGKRSGLDLSPDLNE